MSSGTGGRSNIIVSPAGKQVRGWKHTDWGDSFPVDVALDDARPRDYSALLLPGGVMNPDKTSVERARSRVREIIRGQEKAHRSDLSWALDIDRGGRGAKSQDDVVAIAAH